MDFQTLVAEMNPDIYQNLKTSLELGKWPNGERLTEDQKELCMQAIIVYEHQRTMDEKDRTGFVERGECSSNPSGEQQTLNIIDLLNGDA